jgi:hypothetical protein
MKVPKAALDIRDEYLQQIMRNKAKGKNTLATDLGILLNLSTPLTQDLGVEVTMLFLQKGRVDFTGLVTLLIFTHR